MSTPITTDVSDFRGPPSGFDSQDPRWTAYVLGELEPADRVACEGILAASPEGRRFVEELRELSRSLEVELRTEPMPALTGSQREIVTLSALEARATVPAKSGAAGRWKRWGASLALTLAVAGGVAMLPRPQSDTALQTPDSTVAVTNWSRDSYADGLAAARHRTAGFDDVEQTPSYWDESKGVGGDKVASSSMGRQPVTRGLNRAGGMEQEVLAATAPSAATPVTAAGAAAAPATTLALRAPASGPIAGKPIAPATPRPVELSAVAARSYAAPSGDVSGAQIASGPKRGGVARNGVAQFSRDAKDPELAQTQPAAEVDALALVDAQPRQNQGRPLSERARRVLGTELETRAKREPVALGYDAKGAEKELAEVDRASGLSKDRPVTVGQTSRLFRSGDQAARAKGKVLTGPQQPGPAAAAVDFYSELGVQKSDGEALGGKPELANKRMEKQLAQSQDKAPAKAAVAGEKLQEVKKLQDLAEGEAVEESLERKPGESKSGDESTPLPALLPMDADHLQDNELAVQVDPAQVRYVMAKVEAEHRERLKQLQGEDRVLELQQNAVDYDSLQQLSTGHNTESYDYVADNTFNVALGETALSTFAIDVDTASYANVRRFLTNGQIPPRGAVRIEELVNYFPYNDAPPAEDQPFTARVEIADCPWQPDHRLARIALKGKTIAKEARPVSNLVFLIDVSGSMQDQNKLPLVREGLRMLVNQLAENDRVAMVVYAGASGLVLPPTNATEKQVILSAIDNLQAGGSTNGGAGIELAYKTAKEHFIKGGTNRVILCTDGDFNVGVSDRDSLVRMVEENAKSNVFLTILGYGMGNIKDATLEQLADKGNGQYGYIDSLAEARKWMVDQMQGTLITIAKDVKIQVEFNPAKVAGYRLIGYENRVMANQDFRNDAKDAGEIGAGHSVTALYELVPAGKTVPTAAATNEFKYQFATTVKPDAQTSDEFLTIRLRHKQPEGEKASEQEFVAKDTGLKYGQASEDFRFSAAVAAFGMILRDSPYKAQATLPAVKELAEAAKGSDPAGYRAEFVELVKRAEQMLPPPVVVEAAVIAAPVEPAAPAPAAAPETPQP
jgi:Ca-activated chloride channel homolog